MQCITQPMMKMLGHSCCSDVDLCPEKLDRPLPNQFENLRRLTQCCGQQAVSEVGAVAQLCPESCQRIRDALIHEVLRTDSSRSIDPPESLPPTDRG